MAGFPPPYPPPAGPPFGYDARQQRQFIKDQRRAQKDMYRAVILQAKQQRDFRRVQERGLRRSSILGPIVVLALGIILLLIGLGRLPLTRFADWYGRWWPLFLVSAGVVLLIEWAFDQVPRADGTPSVRRSIGGGTILLLILLAVAGPVLIGVRDGHDLLAHGFSINPDNFDEIFGEKHEAEQQIDQAFAAGTSLAINNPHGDVTIVGRSGDDHIHISINKQIYVRTDSEADEKAQRLSPRVDLVGSTLTVSMPSMEGATAADLSVTLPDFGETTVTANRGTVNISGLHAPVNVTTNHGDVELNSITGAVNAHINSSGSSFTGHNITGAVAVKGRAQDLTITDVSGDVSLEGEFFGDTHLERLQGPVTFRTSRTQLSLLRLDGDVDLSSHSELTGNQIVGPLRLHTSSRNISFERVAGDVDITNSKGSVDVTSAAPLGNITVENRDGAVNLIVPEQAGFAIDAETRDGAVQNDLALNSTTVNERTALQGRVGDGAARISVHTSHADIAVHRGSVAAPAPPASPQPPAPPASPVPQAPARPAAPRSGKAPSHTI